MLEHCPQHGKERAEEPFLLLAMASLVISTVWLALHPDRLLGFYYSPELLALTHALTLGFATSIVMGVLVRALPMALGVRVRSRRLTLLQLGLFVVGATGMITHFWLAEWVAVAWAALLVVAAALVQAANLAPVLALARAGDWVARHVAAAAVHLMIAALLGAGFAFHNAYGWGAGLFTAPILDRLSAHFHLAAVGWVTTMIVGLQLKLVPTSAGDRRFWPVRFALLQTGVLGLAASLLLGLGAQAPCAALIAAALLWHAWGPLRAVSQRREWIWETAALAVLVALVVGGLLLAVGVPDPASLVRQRAQLAYGYAALHGWVLLTVTAVAFKLFPLWVWQERFAPVFGKEPTPAVVSLYSDRLRNLTGAALTAGVVLVAAGVLAEAAWPVRIGLWLVLAGVAAFLANFVRTARWALLPIQYRPSAAERERFEGRREPGAGEP